MKHKEQIQIALDFQNEFNVISPYNIENLLETLEQKELLSEKGKAFRHIFWEVFIHEGEK